MGHDLFCCGLSLSPVCFAEFHRPREQDNSDADHAPTLKLATHGLRPRDSHNDGANDGQDSSKLLSFEEEDHMFQRA